jgi:hypothetical protein
LSGDVQSALFDELARLVLKLEKGIDLGAKLRVARTSFSQETGSLSGRIFQRGFHQLGYLLCSLRLEH